MNDTLPIIGRSEILQHVDIASLIKPISEAFQAVSDGRSQSNIDVLHPTDFSDLHVKSAVMQGADIFTVKTAGWSAKNEAVGLSASSGMITVFDAVSCRPIAILQDNHLISDLRTAAAGALSVQLLANADATTLGVLGAGEQAYQQIKAARLVRDIKNVYLWNRTPSKAMQLADRLKTDDPALFVQVEGGAQAVVEAADILITATASKEPLVQAEWLRPGMHVTSVGADDATKCELEPACLALADLLVVDSVEAATSYGNLHRALSAGAIDVGVAVEIGKILGSDAKGRESRDDITIATFVGLGSQDLAATQFLRQKLQF